MLEALAVNKDINERVCWLIARQHTYNNIDGIEYKILVEADILVNSAIPVSARNGGFELDEMRLENLNSISLIEN